MFRALYLLIFSTALAADLRSGYTLFPGIGYYKYHSSSATWHDAYKTCLREGGHLAVINSQQEADVLWKNFRQYASKEQPYCYLGLHDLYLQGNFTTIYGEPLDKAGFSHWPRYNCVAQPMCAGNQSVGPGCGAFGAYATEAGFYRLPCNMLQPFFCEKELWYDYELVSNQGYYKLHRIGRSWGEAWKVCQDEGAHLAVIDSTTELNTLQTILARFPDFMQTDRDDRVYLGFHNKLASDVFSTVHGHFLNGTGYMSWDAGQPSSNGTCGGLVRRGRLFLDNCDAKLAFFCEHHIRKI